VGIGTYFLPFSFLFKWCSCPWFLAVSRWFGVMRLKSRTRGGLHAFSGQKGGLLRFLVRFFPRYYTCSCILLLLLVWPWFGLDVNASGF